MPQEQKEQTIEALYDHYEQDLEFVGASAIEDKLQQGVSETIDVLIKANIKVWVLTGDKQETAIEIGKSCKLIQPDMTLHILTRPTEPSLEYELDRLLEEFPEIGNEKSITDISEFKKQHLTDG